MALIPIRKPRPFAGARNKSLRDLYVACGNAEGIVSLTKLSEEQSDRLDTQALLLLKDGTRRTVVYDKMYLADVLAKTDLGQGEGGEYYIPVMLGGNDLFSIALTLTAKHGCDFLPTDFTMTELDGIIRLTATPTSQGYYGFVDIRIGDYIPNLGCDGATIDAVVGMLLQGPLAGFIGDWPLAFDLKLNGEEFTGITIDRVIELLADVDVDVVPLWGFSCVPSAVELPSITLPDNANSIAFLISTNANPHDEVGFDQRIAHVWTDLPELNVPNDIVIPDGLPHSYLIRMDIQTPDFMPTYDMLIGWLRQYLSWGPRSVGEYDIIANFELLFIQNFTIDFNSFQFSSRNSHVLMDDPSTQFLASRPIDARVYFHPIPQSILALNSGVVDALAIGGINETLQLVGCEVCDWVNLG